LEKWLGNELAFWLEVLTDVDRLRDMAFYGIPSEIRGRVWLKLHNFLTVANGSDGEAASKRKWLENVNSDVKSLGQSVASVTVSDTVSEAQRSGKTLSEGRGRVPSSTEAITASFETDDHDILIDSLIMRNLKSEMARYARNNSAFKSTKLQDKVFHILCMYIHRDPSIWTLHEAALVHVLGPFALLQKESDAAHCFNLMIRAIDTYFGPTNGRKTLGRFLMLFRSHLPELFTHFEEEDLEASRWAGSWLRYLLCRELPFACCLRLWDSYFAAPDGHGFALHTYVCLAILENCQLELIELENAELEVFLQQLPTLDIDRVIVQAQYLAHDYRYQ